LIATPLADPSLPDVDRHLPPTIQPPQERAQIG